MLRLTNTYVLEGQEVMMAKETKVAIYARVSTTGKGQDPETQLGLLRSIANAVAGPTQNT